MNSKDFPKGYRPLVVYVPNEAGIYFAKITVGEDYEQIYWMGSDTECDHVFDCATCNGELKCKKCSKSYKCG